jgi:hypothetical protein
MSRIANSLSSSELQPLVRIAILVAAASIGAGFSAVSAESNSDWTAVESSAKRSALCAAVSWARASRISNARISTGDPGAWGASDADSLYSENW